MGFLLYGWQYLFGLSHHNNIPANSLSLGPGSNFVRMSAKLVLVPSLVTCTILATWASLHQ